MYAFGQKVVKGILVLAATSFFALSLSLTTPTRSLAQELSVETRINLLMRQGQFTDAYALARNEWEPDTPNREARLDFILAMSLKAQGRHLEAIQLLRRLNTENPSFTRVRAELAHTLFLVGDHDAARFHFTDLHRNAASTDMRESFDSYLTAIGRQRPYRLGGYVSIAPSTNINNRTTARTITVNGLPFTLGEESRARSGVGLSAGVWGERSFFFDDDMTATLAGRFDGTKYRQAEFDRLQFNASAFLRRRMGVQTFGVGVIGDYHNYGHATYRHGKGGALEYGRILDGGRHLFTSMRVMRQSFPNAAFLDGYQISGTVAGRQAFGPGHYLTVGMRLVTERTKARHYDYHGAGIFLSHSREWRGGFITQFEPSLLWRRYRADDPLFDIRRRDMEAGATVRLMHRKLNFEGFAPRLEYSYLRQASNHPLQRRDNHSVNVVMTREF